MKSAVITLGTTSTKSLVEGKKHIAGEVFHLSFDADMRNIGVNPEDYIGFGGNVQAHAQAIVDGKEIYPEEYAFYSKRFDLSQEGVATMPVSTSSGACQSKAAGYLGACIKFKDWLPRLEQFVRIAANECNGIVHVVVGGGGSAGPSILFEILAVLLSAGEQDETQNLTVKLLIIDPHFVCKDLPNSDIQELMRANSCATMLLLQYVMERGVLAFTDYAQPKLQHRLVPFLIDTRYKANAGFQYPAPSYELDAETYIKGLAHTIAEIINDHSGRLEQTFWPTFFNDKDTLFSENKYYIHVVIKPQIADTLNTFEGYRQQLMARQPITVLQILAKEIGQPEGNVELILEMYVKKGNYNYLSQLINRICANYKPMNATEVIQFIKNFIN